MGLPLATLKLPVARVANHDGVLSMRSALYIMNSAVDGLVLRLSCWRGAIWNGGGTKSTESDCRGAFAVDAGSRSGRRELLR
jgi:hypothetical protein